MSSVLIYFCLCPLNQSSSVTNQRNGPPIDSRNEVTTIKRRLQSIEVLQYIKIIINIIMIMLLYNTYVYNHIGVAQGGAKGAEAPPLLF